MRPDPGRRGVGFLGLESCWKVDVKGVSVVLMGEKLRFSLLNRLHSPGGRQGPHCAPEIGPIRVLGMGFLLRGWWVFGDWEHMIDRTDRMSVVLTTWLEKTGSK